MTEEQDTQRKELEDYGLTREEALSIIAASKLRGESTHD